VTHGQQYVHHVVTVFLLQLLRTVAAQVQGRRLVSGLDGQRRVQAHLHMAHVTYHVNKWDEDNFSHKLRCCFSPKMMFNS